MLKAWTEGEFAHDGRFWQLQVPMLRPRPFTQAAPGGDPRLLGRRIARRAGAPGQALHDERAVARNDERAGSSFIGRPCARPGFGEAAVAANLAASWVWRNFYVAESDDEAERIGIPAFETMTRARAEMRNRIFAETGARIAVPKSDLPGARTARGDGLIHGTPASVAEDVAALDRLGIGGIIGTFRLGPMPHEVAAESLTRFMREVAPNFRGADGR